MTFKSIVVNDDVIPSLREITEKGHLAVYMAIEGLSWERFDSSASSCSTLNQGLRAMTTLGTSSSRALRPRKKVTWDMSEKVKLGTAVVSGGLESESTTTWVQISL